ncbi:MAG: hypothetical protein MK102_10955 [Fuerstiella sp.]|nr:hypothetical protein [Fuerstiella sp.]
MKGFLVIGILAWGAMILEQSRPAVLPAGAVLLPLVMISMLWNRTAGGIFAGGVVLILDWIARPQGIPLLPVVLTFAATVLLVRTASDPWTGTEIRQPQFPEWIQPTILVVIAILVSTGPTIVTQRSSLADALHLIRSYAMVSIPLTVLMTGVMKLAAEFGLRRVS